MNIFTRWASRSLISMILLKSVSVVAKLDDLREETQRLESIYHQKLVALV